MTRNHKRHKKILRSIYLVKYIWSNIYLEFLNILLFLFYYIISILLNQSKTLTFFYEYLY